MPKNFFGNPGLTLQLKPIGKWAEAIRTFQRLDPAIKRASLAAQIAVCEEIAKQVKGHLRKQDLGWRALSPSYLAAKQAKGWDGRILLATHTYYDNITTFVKGTQHIAFVGVKRGIYGKKLDGKKNKLEVAVIATIHEFSNNAKRRRPLWNPTIRKMGSSKGIKALYLKFLTRELKKQRIPLDVINQLRWR